MGAGALRVLLVLVILFASLGSWPSLVLLRHTIAETRRTRGWPAIHGIVARGHLRSSVIRALVLCLFVSDAIVLLRVPSNDYVLPYELIIGAFMLLVAALVLTASLLDLKARRAIRDSMTTSDAETSEAPNRRTTAR